MHKPLNTEEWELLGAETSVETLNRIYLNTDKPKLSKWQRFKRLMKSLDWNSITPEMLYKNEDMGD
jgi:hypothetical protein